MLCFHKLSYRILHHKEEIEIESSRSEQEGYPIRWTQGRLLIDEQCGRNTGLC